MSELTVRLLTGIGVTAAFLPSLAFAQETATPGVEQAEVFESQASAGEAGPAGDIVVTGFRQSLRTAQNIKRNASEIVDSIVAEDIGKLPDNNLAEALQRVPGVQITRHHGEGSGISIRGLTQTSTLVNGREAFSDNGRSLSLEAIPAEVLAGIDVYKNPSAALIEGGLGGVVNLKTRRPFDFAGFQASLSVRNNYYDFVERSRPQVSGLVSTRFDTGAGEIGILLGGAFIRSAGRRDQQGAEPFNNRYNLVDFNGNGVFGGIDATNAAAQAVDPGDLVLAPNGGGATIEITDRTRTAFNGAIQWKPSERLSVYFEGFYNRYKYEQEGYLAYANRGPLLAAPDATFTFHEGTNVVRSGSYRDVEFTANASLAPSRSRVWQLAGGAEWEATDNLKLSADLAYTDSTRTSDFSATRVGNNGNTAGTRLDFDTQGDQVLLNLTGFDFDNIAKYRFLESFAQTEVASSDGWAGRADAEYSFTDSVLKSVSIGGRFTDRNVDRRQGTQNHFPPAAPGQPANTFPGTVLPEAFVPIGLANNFYRNGNVPNPMNVVLSVPIWLQRDQARLCQVFGDTVCEPQFNPANTYSQQERTYAAYGQAGFDLEPLGIPVDGTFGARYLKTELSTVGVVTAPTGATSPINQDSSYENFLPSANIRFKIMPDLFLRLAAAKQLTRPGFGSLSPTLNVTSLAASGVLNINAGNPDLRPLRSTSYDASLEYYFTRNGYAYLSGFKKDVSGFIQNFISRETVNLPAFPNVTQADINRPQNGDDGSIKGFEVGVQTFFDFLPQPLDGFGIQANYTYVDSKAPGPIAGETVPLEGLSKNSYNLVGFYEKNGIRARVAYTWRDDYVETTSGPGSGALPIYVRPFDQLDASIGYTVNDHFDISLDASNLLNSSTNTYFGETIRPRFNSVVDRRIGLVVRIKS
ncbi:TonB-dependent receptor [Sphingomonas sp. ac-8]|uniref:TonB-dependent receptor n=1 Tax=Sphingomonas sp. ac-8 TaxID=3242977 RepID=UPI003A802DD5